MRMSPLLLLASTVAVTGCNPTVNFTVPFEGEATIAGGGLVPGLLDVFGIGDLAQPDFSNTQEFENNDVRKEQVVSTRLQKLTLTIVEGDADFDFLDSLSFSVEAPDLAKERVASMDAVPEGVTTFDLDLDDLDIAAYVRADSLSLTSDIDGSQPSEDTRIRIELLFDVTAEVLAD